MKLKNPTTTDIVLTEAECNFLVNVLLDWDQSQKNQTKSEKQMWERLIATLDPYLNDK